MKGEESVNARASGGWKILDARVRVNADRWRGSIHNSWYDYATNNQRIGRGSRDA